MGDLLDGRARFEARAEAALNKLEFQARFAGHIPERSATVHHLTVGDSIAACAPCQSGACDVEMIRTDLGLTLTHWPRWPLDPLCD